MVSSLRPFVHSVSSLQHAILCAAVFCTMLPALSTLIMMYELIGMLARCPQRNTCAPIACSIVVESCPVSASPSLKLQLQV